MIIFLSMGGYPIMYYYNDQMVLQIWWGDIESGGRVVTETLTAARQVRKNLEIIYDSGDP